MACKIFWNVGGDKNAFRTGNRQHYGVCTAHRTTEDAFEIALKVLTALKRKRNLVPLINKDGSKEKNCLRLDDPSAKVIDTGTAQITLSWTSRRPYDYEKVQKMMEWEVNGWKSSDTRDYVAKAFENVVRDTGLGYRLS